MAPTSWSRGERVDDGPASGRCGTIPFRYLARRAGGSRLRRMWSKDRVLKALRVWRQGNPQTMLRSVDTGLEMAARTYFGSVDEALLAAGLEPRPQKWNKQRLIEAIQDRHVRGLSLSNGVTNEDTALIASARYHFGSWRAALRAAGIERPVPRRWSKQLVIEEIQLRHRQGLSLRSVFKDDCALNSAVYRYFPNWKAARAAAGLEEAA